jgi:hypothetical protein
MLKLRMKIVSMFAPNVVSVKVKDFSIAETETYYHTAPGDSKNWRSNDEMLARRKPPL